MMTNTTSPGLDSDLRKTATMAMRTDMAIAIETTDAINITKIDVTITRQTRAMDVAIPMTAYRGHPATTHLLVFIKHPETAKRLS